MTFVDTHCHLFWDDFSDDLDDVLARARAVGVARFIVPATNVSTGKQAAAIAGRHPDVFATAGVHPHDASDFGADTIEALRALLRGRRAIAIGEIGLDYHYDYCPPPRQHEALRAQLALAKEHALPVIVHNREADADLLAICREEQDGTLSGQFHCFSSDVDVARSVLELGFHISFTGNVTFRKSALDEVLRFVPDDRLLIETDAPFMSPAPHRGTRNEPARIPLIAERFASVRGVTVAYIARVTTRNAERLFGLPPLPGGAG